jgi:hypothetical protein
MTYDEDSSEFVLSTGRRFYAHAGILGLPDPDDGAFYGAELLYGYDGDVGDKFTREERQEIANFMIARWRDWSMRV